MKRIDWIDDLKGLGILLIVLGHVVATIQSMVCGAPANVLGETFEYIYSFHVPFFFLLAGLTFSTRDSFVAFLKKKFMRLMVPYFIWGLLSAALFALIGTTVVKSMESAEFAGKSLSGKWWTPFVSILQAGGWPEGKGFRFNGVLWFLPVLFSAELIYYPIAKRIWKTWHFVLITSLIAIALSPFYWPFLKLQLPYGLCRVPEYLVFMIIGDWIGWMLRNEGNNQISFLKSMRTYLPWSFFAVALMIAAVLCHIRGELIRYPLIVTKAFMTIVPILLVAGYHPFKWFGWLSPHTIAIMLFHKFLLVSMQIGVVKVGVLNQIPWVGSFGCVIVFTVICISICYFISRVLSRFAPWSLGVRRSLCQCIG